MKETHLRGARSSGRLASFSSRASAASGTGSTTGVAAPDLARTLPPDLAPAAETEASPPYAVGQASRTAAGTAPQRAISAAPSAEPSASEVSEASASTIMVSSASSSTGVDLDALSRLVNMARPFSSTNAAYWNVPPPSGNELDSMHLTPACKRTGIKLLLPKKAVFQPASREQEAKARSI